MMLSSSQVTNSNNQPTLKNSTTCQISSSNVSKSPSNLQSMKCESFVAASPAIDDTSKLQENPAEQNTKLRECEVPSSISMHGQKTNKYLNSTRAEVSPKNAGENQNSNNITLKSNKNEKLTKDIIEDLNNEKTPNAKRATASSKEDETDKSLSDKSSNGTIVKDEEDILNGIGSIKKEENISPQLSPGGFDISDSGNATENLNHVKCNLGPQKNAHQLNQKDRSINALNTDESTSCNINSNQINEPNTQYLPSNNNANFMQDFMQQQNHIFVFSTQLANKGAESVLNGHFPTIIAYHCMQPTTKSFLEDFFSKNPMKVTKLQRQTSINFANTNNQGNAHWLNSCNTKMSQKNCNSKINIGNVNSPLENNKSTVPFSIRGNASNAFPETADVLSNENEFFSWDQIRNNLEGETLKILEGVGTGLKSQQASNKAIGFMESNDNNIPSLQGVKVPDENLTPQQRQHREEQLAKIKKMNQFLFPENGSDFKIDCASVLGTNNQLTKLPPENVSNILMCNQMNAQMNQTVQNNAANVINQSQQLNCNTENIAVLNEEQAISSEVMTTQESGSIQCNVNKVSCSSNGTRSNVQRTTCPSNAIMVGSNGNVNSTTDILNEFNQNNISACPSNKNGTSIQRGDDNHSNIAQLEWSKPQQHFYDERLKNKQLGDMGNSISSSNSSTINNNVRCSTHNNPSNSTNASNNARTIQGPPPPYHSTQRSASVPIAQSQSPNPSSPTNPTSNLSLPSPHTSGATGIRENSPSIDAHTSLQSNTAGNIATISTNPCNQSKTNFHPDGSPSHANRNRSGFSQLNSNPSTPLSHMSPKDVEPFSASGAQDLKNPRPSPQAPRSPTMSTNQNNVEQYNTDGRFNSGSPGLNFCPPIHSVNSNSSYKSPGSMERHNSVSLTSQFCRRTENLPLNPNSSRAPPSKLNTSFDPISSLAQMSQQLTSCTSHNPHVGPSATGIGLGGMSDMPLMSSVNQNLDSIIHPSEGSIDHCGTNANSMGGIPPHVGNAGPYAANNCHQMMGPIGQRMLNPKLCGNFHPGSTNLRDVQGNIHLGPGPRMVGGRMQMNFNNFNVSPNIQVKASTPNTIQYMPVRPQSNNNNLRPPPSLEFLQRYANPQISMGVNIIDSGQILQGNTGLNNDQNKMPGNINNQGMNYFQNCNQTMMGLDQDDLSQGVSGTDINLGAPIIRGGRPVRQHSLPPRMQNINTGNQQFSTGSQDSLECSADPANIYNTIGDNVIGPSQIFPNNQQKGLKGICQSMNSSSSNNNSSMTNSGSMPNEHNVNLHSALNSSTMIGSNSSGNNVPTGSSINSNGNYKYLGPTPNDIKYAQQYHSFQQQLYATSTRNQHGPATNGVGTNPSTNPTFFVNK